MFLDDAPVLVGDRVWHDRYGWGTVQFVDTGLCDVIFDGSNNPVSFTQGGMSSNFKVLWWQEPILFTPKKGVDYSGLREMVRALMKFKGWDK